MRGRGGAGLRVQSQGRAYAAVIGVTVGMLVVGLAVPLAFGHEPSTAPAASDSVTLDPGLASPAPAQPGAGAPTTAATLPGARPGAGAPGAGLPAGTVAPGTTPGGGTTGGTSGTSGTSGAAPGRLTATDVGVTATTVKVGVVLLDIQKLQPVGFSQPNFTPSDQQARFQAFFDAVNKRGGLAHRKVVLVYRTWDALDTNGSHSAAAVCSQLAEDEKVFAAVGFLGGNIAECLTGQHGIPAVADAGHIAEAYTKSHFRLATPFARVERGTANWGYLSVTSGLVRGRKTGTVSMDVTEESRAEQSLVDALKAQGQPVTYRAHLANDQATAQSQLPVEVGKMQQAGVNTVFLSTNFIAALQFAQTAEKQGFRPQYVVSDFGSLQAEGLVRDMPSSFDGAYLFTQSLPLSPETPPNTACRQEYNANNGSNKDLSGPDPGGSLTLACWMAHVLDMAAGKLGTHLTRQGIGDAFQQLGAPTLPHTQPGSFGPGKTDWVDWMRIARYSTACHCYKPVSGSQHGRY